MIVISSVVAGDYGQNIIEIMGDAACERANGLHLLGLPELLGQLLLVNELSNLTAKRGPVLIEVLCRAPALPL